MKQVSIHLFPVVAKFAIIRCTTSFIQKTLPAAMGRGKQENRGILRTGIPDTSFPAFACTSRIPYFRELKYDCNHASNASTKSSSFTAWSSNFLTVSFPGIPL